MIVVDASVFLEMLLRSRRGQAAETRILDGNETVHAPALIDLEVAQVLRRYESRGELTAARARESLNIFGLFSIQRYMHEPLMSRIWELRDNLTAYDAAYVALAEGLRAPLVTCDTRLARSPGLRARIEVL